MPSPFPGMNPYLEQEVWRDFHQRYCTALSEFLITQTRPRYIVALEENVYIHGPGEREREPHVVADVALSRSERAHHAAGVALAAEPIEAPAYALVPTIVEVERWPYIEVRDRHSREVVTIIELLSPTNKRVGEDRAAYITKRRRLLSGPAHFVELDLLRGGPRLPLDLLPDCDYYALVSRAEDRPHVGVWPIRLRDRLPVIPIPLRAPDPDARIDLQAVLHHVYDVAGYADYIYDGQPQPPLHPEDAAWARSLIPARADA